MVLAFCPYLVTYGPTAMTASNRFARAGMSEKHPCLKGNLYCGLGASVRTINPHPSLKLPVLLPCLYPRRTAIMDYVRPKKRNILDPLDPDFLKRKPTGLPQSPQAAPQQGDLAPTSIFDEGEKRIKPTSTQPNRSRPSARDPTVLAAALDPDPEARRRWQRRKIIQEIRNRGQLSKAQMIARTERESLCKSQFYETSVKKLMPLARQIAGKPIEEAIIQMRFSKKRVAKDVKKHLEYARDEAIVKRGMGLGMVRPEADTAAEAEETDNATEETGEQNQQWSGMVVEDKKGKRRYVSDKSSIYVDEAWVGRGPYGIDYDIRARGRVNLLRPPETSTFLQIGQNDAYRMKLTDSKALR